MTNHFISTAMHFEISIYTKVHSSGHDFRTLDIQAHAWYAIFFYNPSIFIAYIITNDTWPKYFLSTSFKMAWLVGKAFTRNRKHVQFQHFVYYFEYIWHLRLKYLTLTVLYYVEHCEYFSYHIKCIDTNLIKVLILLDPINCNAISINAKLS